MWVYEKTINETYLSVICCLELYTKINSKMSKVRRLRSSAEEKEEVPQEDPLMLLAGATISLDDNARANRLLKAQASSKEKVIENAKQLNHVLSFQNLKIHFLEPEYGNGFYRAVAFCIERLPPPYNMVYPVKVLRHKVAEYMIGHQAKFIKKFKTEESLRRYCEAVATTRLYASTETEMSAMAHALQIKIELYYEMKLATTGFLIEEHGEAYSQSIKLTYIDKLKEFLPIVETL